MQYCCPVLFGTLCALSFPSASPGRCKGIYHKPQEILPVAGSSRGFKDIGSLSDKSPVHHMCTVAVSTARASKASESTASSWTPGGLVTPDKIPKALTMC